MPRAMGQIDVSKHEAVLEAASEVFAERGLSASLDEVARRAGVSKQTIYNRFGSKDQLLRELVARRRHELAAVLEAPGALERPEKTLASYALSLLEIYEDKERSNFLRLVITAAQDQPEMARIVYEAGPKAGRAQLAEFLAAEHRAGRLVVEDADEAAEIFGGMVAGQRPIRMLLTGPQPTSAAWRSARARTCARRFMRAYAP